MDLQYAAAIAESLMNQHQLTAKGWRFQFDQAKARGGLCSYRRKTISLSRELVARADKTFMINTLLHEIAHALVGWEHGHGPVWRKMARRIGGTPDRTHYVKPRWNYIGVCAKCGDEIHAMRKILCSCKRCSPGRYDRNAMFMWKPAGNRFKRRDTRSNEKGPQQLTLEFPVGGNDERE